MFRKGKHMRALQPRKRKRSLRNYGKRQLELQEITAESAQL